MPGVTPSILGVIPTYMRNGRDLEMALATVKACRATDPSVDLLVSDDCSPEQGLLDELEGQTGVEVVRNLERGGYSRTVNVGFRRALADGRDVVQINADLCPQTRNWGRAFQEQLDAQGRPAAIVGGLLLYGSGPCSGLIQSAGSYFSVLTKTPDHRFRFAPGNLPEAQIPTICLVTAAFQFVRLTEIGELGLYSENYRLGFEDVDAGLRCFTAGYECVYQPAVIALHHESAIRGRGGDKQIDEWHRQSSERLYKDHAHTNLMPYLPALHAPAHAPAHAPTVPVAP